MVSVPFYGLSGIPETWLSRLAWKDRLLEAGRRLLPASLRSPRYDRARSSPPNPDPGRFVGLTDDMRVIGVWDDATQKVIYFTPEEQAESDEKHRKACELKARQARNR